MLRLTVDGMSCGHCVRAVTEAVRSLDPAAEVKVDLPGRTVSARTGLDAETVARAIREAGYAVG